MTLIDYRRPLSEQRPAAGTSTDPSAPDRSTPRGRLEVVGPLGPRFEEILTPEALDFLALLHDRFASRRTELLTARTLRRESIAGGAMFDFLPATRAIREDRSWRVAGPGPGLEDRRGYLAPGMDADFILVDTDPCAAEGLSSDALNTEAAAQSSDSNGSHKPADGLLGYDSEEALFAHAEAIRDTRVVLTVVGGEIKYRA